MLSVARTTFINCSGWPGIEPLEVPGLTAEDARQNDRRGVLWTPLRVIPRPSTPSPPDDLSKET